MDQPLYTVEPWCVRETELHLERLAETEAVFTVANGHIGLRGNLDEGEPHGIPGTYLNSVYELRPLPYGEAGYGYPESGESIINVTNGKIMRLLVDDEPFDVRYGRVVHHERVLDLRAGSLRREVVWESPAGCCVTVSSHRLVSLTQRSVAAICYEVAPRDVALRVVVQSELVPNETLPDLGKDPRVAAALESPLEIETHESLDRGAVMVHRVRQSGLLVAAAMEHEIDGPEGCEVEAATSPDSARLTIVSRLDPGERLRVIKYLAYGWSRRRSRPAMRDQVLAALAAAGHTGWEGLLEEQRQFLDDFWQGADVEVEADPEVQQAVRFNLFQVLQAGARAERRPIGAKGLTGPGYDGHTFWDSEMFVLPVLIHTQSGAAAQALHWRYNTLDKAKDRAQQLGLVGAAFPWRTISGRECSSYWPAGTAAFHVNADIADAVVRYIDATGDDEFAQEAGLGLLVETARLWRRLGHHDSVGRFRIDGVTGPDEYSALADNNVYTNLMAEQNLRRAADEIARFPGKAQELGVTLEEAASWRDAAEDMMIPFDEALGVHPQSEEFTEHDRWNFASTPPECYPLFLFYPYFDLYRRQVVKQADLVLAMHVRPEAFTAEQKERNFAYYEELTVRDSSLSAASQAVVAAAVGHLGLAYDYLGETALMDLHNLEGNTGVGLHLAALAGSWTVLVAGFGGMRMSPEGLSFAPQMPEHLPRLSFRMCYRGRRVGVAVTSTDATYTLVAGEPLVITHHGERLDLDDQPVTAALPDPVHRPRPSQPQGRAPRRRS